MHCPDGRRVLRFDTVFKGVGSIVEGQVVQESPQQFTINVVVAGDFTENDRKTLLHNFQQHIDQVQVEVMVVPQIPRTASGKFRAVINRCSDAHRASDNTVSSTNNVVRNVLCHPQQLVL